MEKINLKTSLTEAIDVNDCLNFFNKMELIKSQKAMKKLQSIEEKILNKERKKLFWTIKKRWIGIQKTKTLLSRNNIIKLNILEMEDQFLINIWSKVLGTYKFIEKGCYIDDLDDN